MHVFLNIHYDIFQDRCFFTVDCVFPSTCQIINMSEAIRTVIIFHQLRPTKTFIFDYNVANGNWFLLPFYLEPATDYRIYILQARESRCVNITSSSINFVGLNCSTVYTFRSCKYIYNSILILGPMVVKTVKLNYINWIWHCVRWGARGFLHHKYVYFPSKPLIQ